MTTQSSVERLHNLICRSIFTIDPPLGYSRIVDALTALGSAVHSLPDDADVWLMGETGDATLADLIVGAYWHLAEWHSGQWSPGYAALCSLGQVYSPGMESGPAPDSGEAYVYESLEYIANV